MDINCPQCQRHHAAPFFHCPACGTELVKVFQVGGAEQFQIAFQWHGAEPRRFMLIRNGQHLLDRLQRIELTKDGLLAEDSVAGRLRLPLLEVYCQLGDDRQTLEFD